MAKIAKLNEAKWCEFLAGLPESARAVAEKYPPDRLYRLDPPGQRVTVLSYGDDGTVRVNVSSEHNFVVFDRQVFGVDPANLVECDLPEPGELVGSLESGEARRV